MEKTPPDMKVRLSADLRRKIVDAAQENNRTLNSEIVFRLEASFRDGAGQSATAVDQASELEALRTQVRALESRIPADLIVRLSKLDALLNELDGKVVVTVDKAD
ncbi:Arc family DNA-binding protein [Sphingosinicella soli]|uniref:Arc-like DNA binding domain-containing protein n=1 Tax=Sphingosinicella soli TaxID=333708 RepID=A0A7W7FAK9_9SPHN|nr:Arc family DNA-binding protein [Sphingosinicella soli]MBB4633788.1 hypothetical protein [Sphingosinicella soli]